VVVSVVVYGCFDSRGDTKIHSSLFPFYEVDTMSGTYRTHMVNNNIDMMSKTSWRGLDDDITPPGTILFLMLD